MRIPHFMKFRLAILTVTKRRSQKSILSNCGLIFVRAPTTKAVGYIDVTKLEPTASVVGLP